MNPEQPAAGPKRTKDGQPVTPGGVDGQYTTGGPTGQEPDGPETAEDQAAPVGRTVEGQSTSSRHPSRPGSR